MNGSAAVLVSRPPGLDRHEAALVLDGHLRRLASQNARCRAVLGRLARRFLGLRGQHQLGFARLGDYTGEPARPLGTRGARPRRPSAPAWSVCPGSVPPSAADSLAGGLEKLLLHVKAEWEAQPQHRDPIFARDGWRCAVPVCTARRNLHDHHLVFRSRGGGNARENRITLCAWHHLRGIHGGRIRAWGEGPDDVTWEIGVRAGRRPLLRLVTVTPVDSTM